MKGARLLFLASWIILLVVSAFTALIAFNALRVAYSDSADDLASTMTVQQIREIGGETALKNYRGRRATAATFALGFAILAGFIAGVPYRRAEKWSWWALFVSVLVSQLLSLARVFMIGTTLGTGAAGLLLSFFLLGLLAGVPRIFFREPDLT
jgi:hypothetical protein